MKDAPRDGTMILALDIYEKPLVISYSKTRQDQPTSPWWDHRDSPGSRTSSNGLWCWTALPAEDRQQGLRRTGLDKLSSDERWALGLTRTDQAT